MRYQKLSLALVTLTVSLLIREADAPSIPVDTLPKDLPTSTLPLGLKDRPEPKDNPTTTEKVALGRKLFFDPILSGDRTVACASCHLPNKAFASDGIPLGIQGQKLDRKAPALVNRAWASSLFWDGRASTLEEQALKPIEDPKEMGAKLPEVLMRLQDNKDYVEAFAKAFPQEKITNETLAKALAAFQRVLVRGDSPVDRFIFKGDRGGITEEQLHGFWLYESKGLCWKCHTGTNFTNDGFHNTGIGGGREPGRSAVTGKTEDMGKFKTPTLRGAGVSGPYMHDASLKTLEDVVEFYNRGGNPNENLDKILKPLNLTDEDKKALVAFLKCL